MTSTDQQKPKRGRPAGSKNAAKPENENAKAKEPRNNVTESLVLLHLSKIIAAEQKKDTAVANLRTARKAAKGDGVDLKTLDAVRHLASLDEHEITAGFNSIAQYSKFLSVPLYSQFDLFDSPAAAEEAVNERAFHKGIKAGKFGEGPEKNPYDPTSVAGQEWARGWGEGQAILMKGFGEAGNA
jgi:ribosome modulation factor